jgi:hypothetical protein
MSESQSKAVSVCEVKLEIKMQRTEMKFAAATMPSIVSPVCVADRLSCRQVLNIMVILGFMFNYMLRVNLTIAIVAMVVPGNKTDSPHSNATLTECSDSTLPPANATTLFEAPAQPPEVR